MSLLQGCYEPKINLVNPPTNQTTSHDEGGYVTGVITYMIMDDLAVRPMSTISCITLLNKFNIKDIWLLEEKPIDIGTDECVKLPKAVLTDVFLEKKTGQSKTSSSSGGIQLWFRKWWLIFCLQAVFKNPSVVRDSH